MIPLEDHYFNKHICFFLYNNRVTACQNHTYGTECSEFCGYCLNEQQCDNVNGTCHNGCEAGYYSDRCTRGIKLVLV